MLVLEDVGGLPSSLWISSVPEIPASSPVPESGTIVTVSLASPFSIKPWCWRTNEPDLRPTEPVKCSMATYPAEPGVAV